MLLSLPPVKKTGTLSFDHFPTLMQCFIYRNWGIVTTERMALVLGTTEDVVIQLAADMGLPPVEYDPKWETAGYITIIKANWHLLTYEQLCTLLHISREKLAFILKEDDFLDVKMGRFKFETQPLVYRPLTEEEQARTADVRRATLEALQKFAPQTVKPFDFKPMLARNIRSVGAPAGKERFDVRMVYSYCALYGDTFLGNFEDSFPHALLSAYRSAGINGIWCQAVLYTLVEFPFAPELSEGYKKRAEGLRRLTERLDEYGIKLYLYLNEPRGLPLSYFASHLELKGAVHGDTVSLCTSNEQVRKYLYDGAAALVRSAPKLGGFFTITVSENHTNCYSHHTEQSQTCPACAKRRKSEVLAEVNTLLYNGAASVNPDFRLIAYSWGWTAEETADICRRMPANIGVMSVSEHDVKKTVGGVDTQVDDYSISVVGPGDYAKGIWNAALKEGHPTYAKCQFNNTWECSAVPFLPVFEQIYCHMTRLIHSGVSGLMLTWTLGGYPSPTFAMLSEMFYDKGYLPTLDQMYAAVFPAEVLETVKAACHLFSDAFDKYPFHLLNLYKGPQNIGCSNLLYEHPTDMRATMICLPYDDLDSWRAVYPEPVFEEQLKHLTEEWTEGLRLLAALPEDTVQSYPVLAELLDSAEAAYCHFRSTYLQTRFIRMRDKKMTGDIGAVIDEEMELTVRTANVSAKNSTIGYEPSNHYFYTRWQLMEKYVNCKYIKDKFCQA